ncbi:ribosome maturation factor RimP [Arthrobacter tecti]
MGKQTTPAANRRSTPPAHVNPADEAARLREFLQPVVQKHGLLLEDVEVRIAGSHRTVNVIVDVTEDQEGGVSLETISDVSHSLSEAMDADPQDDGRPYNLEVSSPGVSRPLTEPRHWRRNVGRLVSVELIDGDELVGRLIEAQDTLVVVRPQLPVKKGMKPKVGQEQELAYDRIRKGTVQVEFTHAEAEEPGGEDV